MSGYTWEVGTGNWQDTSSWGGGPPGPNDQAAVYNPAVINGYGSAAVLFVLNETGGVTLDGAFSIGFIETFVSLDIYGTLDTFGDTSTPYYGLFQYGGSVDIEAGAVVNASAYLAAYYAGVEFMDIRGGTLDIATPTQINNQNYVEGGFQVVAPAFIFLQSDGTLQTTYLALENSSAIITVDHSSLTVTQTGTDPGDTAGIQLEAGSLVVTDGGTLDTTFLGESAIGQTVPSGNLFLIDGATATISAPFDEINGLVISDGNTVIQNQSTVTASQVIVHAPSSLSDPSYPGLTVSGSTLLVTNTEFAANLSPGGMALDDGRTIITKSATVTVDGQLVMDSPAYFTTSLTVDAIAMLDVMGNMAFGASANANVGLAIYSGGAMEIGGDLAGTITNELLVDAGASFTGHGLIDSDQTDTVMIGNTPQPLYALNITDDGVIDANQGTLIIHGNIQGSGSLQLEAGATLELGGVWGKTVPVNFVGSGTHTLILDNPTVLTTGTEVNGPITGIALGDQILLSNTSAANGNGLDAATIGMSGTTQYLQVEGNNLGPIYIPISGTAPGGTLAGDYFQVSQGIGSTSTTLTLTQGNPVDLAVNGVAAQQDFNVAGAGIRIGVISDSFNDLGDMDADIAAGLLPANVTVIQDGVGGSDEGRAMAQIIHDIAPAAAIDFYTAGTTGAQGFVAAITALQNAGCNIIVDDIGFNESTIPPGQPNDLPGGPIDQAVETAVDNGVTYITSAGNERITGKYPNGTPTNYPVEIYGHSNDPDALTVAAMDMLATPYPVGGYITPQTESFSSVGTLGSNKPDITGPDGGPTSLQLGNGLSPFFGTSAAAPAVAAVAALMMQENTHLKTNPLLIDQLIEQSATAFTDPAAATLGVSQAQTEGAGLVNADAAVSLAHTVCYLRGTHILTDHGEVAVEDLVIGDRLINRNGEARALRWIGRRSYARPFIARNPEILPILIRSGAIAPGVPARDLYVSPRHALYFAESLIPAASLVNGATILQVRASAHVAYFHLELDTHDVIIAEGALAESYLDCDNRAIFHNTAEYAALYPGQVAKPAQDCAPRLEQGERVDAVWSELAARAVGMGYAVPRPYRISLATAGVTRAVIPAGVAELRLLSGAEHVAGDRRQLGALVTAVDVDGRAIDLTDRSLSRGFHRPERHGANCVRWTNGEGVVLLDPAATRRVVEVSVSAVAPLRAAS